MPAPRPCPSGIHTAGRECTCTQTGCCLRWTAREEVCALCERCPRCCRDYGECRACPGVTDVNGVSRRCRNRIRIVLGNPQACVACLRCTSCCTTANVCHTCPQPVCQRRVNGRLWCDSCNICRNCCRCWQCPSCSGNVRGTIRPCRTCTCCQTCCGCRNCTICNAPRSRFCEECGYCADHCRNVDDHNEEYWVDLRPERLRPAPATIPFHKYQLRFWDATKEQFKVNTLKRHLSVEIECDSVPNRGSKFPAAIKKWRDSVVTDGSLHGTNAHEVNTQPSNGDVFVSHIRDLGDGYKELGASCTPSCGLHVHVNCKDLKFYDLRKVILLYSRIEKALFELCSPERINGRYSLLCGDNYANMSPDPDTFKRQIMGKFYLDKALPSRPTKENGRAITKGKAQKYIGHRYRALNLHSFFLRKTIEFRHRQGSVDADTIINWAMICGHVIEAANIMSESQIRELPKDSKKALLAILPDYLGQYAKGVWNSQPEFNWSGVSKATPDLPSVPKEEVRMDNRTSRRKRRAEKRAKARIGEQRIRALRAIVTGVRLDDIPSRLPNQRPPQTAAVPERPANS